MTAPHVRRLTGRDVPAILELAEHFHRASPFFRDLAFSPVKVDQLVRATMFDPKWLGIVALADEAIVGMALMYAEQTYFGPDIEVVDLAFYVAPDARGRGGFDAMFAVIREWAVARGARRLTLSERTGIEPERTRGAFARYLQPHGTIWSLELPG